MLRRLIDLSCSDRQPYSEARALLDKGAQDEVMGVVWFSLRFGDCNLCPLRGD